jgi:hypothetical protein
MLHHPLQILHNTQHVTEELRAQAAQHQMVQKTLEPIQLRASNGSGLIKWMRRAAMRTAHRM